MYDLYQSSATDDGEEKRACCKVKASHPADGEMYFSFLGQPHKAQSIDRETVDEGKAVKHTHVRTDGWAKRWSRRNWPAPLLLRVLLIDLI